ncbi:DNA-directed RNA polymerase I subunit RPA43 [Danaus plexippus]|uniref:RPA43N protein n=1 Tax=Danaus plexippus plexippus TaxID=278856 RepID=A0A212EZS8_DANPL|nr:DNA-directed RNA polymerase I subunit RPA43 [Danaus plexippus]OWR47006.1 RPA43N protein [Danaus plexippus plexippus]
MSTIIKFELKELRELANDKKSCVIEKKVIQNLALQPWCLGNLKDSIKNLLDYKIGKFDKEFNGILISYKNLRILQNIGAIRNDNADIHFQVQADYFLFRPYVGATLKGVVNKKSATHLAILVHRVFNVVIPRPTEEPGNYWSGSNIEEGQEVVFQIVVLDLYGALPYIRGKLDEQWLKVLQDGDDEIEIKRTKPLNISYVDFDKTKPKYANEKSLNSSETNTAENSHSNDKTENNVKQDNNITEKIKNKRRSKINDLEEQYSEDSANKPKKRKKDKQE